MSTNETTNAPETTNETANESTLTPTLAPVKVEIPRPATLRPGLLVAFSVRGHDRGLSYVKDDVQPTDAAPDGGTVATWQTTRTIADADEHDRMVKIQGKISGMVRKHLVTTEFGSFVSEATLPFLMSAIGAARTLCDEHNAGAFYTTVNVYFRTALLASDDMQAARDISAETLRVFARLNGAIDRLEPDAIREEIKSLQAFAGMLGADESAKVGAAVDAARSAANKIAKRFREANKDGVGPVDAPALLASLQREAIETARFAFLDTSETPTVDGPILASADEGRFGALDMTASPVSVKPTPVTPTVEIDPSTPDYTATVETADTSDADASPVSLAIF